MAKTAQSQWEFGELFPAEELRKVLTVSELTGSIRRTLEKEVGTVSVMGEITNLRHFFLVPQMITGSDNIHPRIEQLVCCGGSNSRTAC